MRCPHCSQETMPQKQLRFAADFSATEYSVCLFCGGEIYCDIEPSEDKTARLAALFGGEKVEHIIIAEEEKRFCRDCAEYIAHPFASRCALRKIVVEPMNDCEDFSPVKGNQVKETE